MRNCCYWACKRTNDTKILSTGLRATFFYPGGGTYKGYWLNNQPHGYGVKTSKNNLIYDGQFKHGKRHGYGTIRHKVGNRYERIYVGEWRDDMKCGEGKHFFQEGTYYGFWCKNRRHGLGIMWYRDGRLYMGSWEANVYHGLGVLFYPNGNRYEGCFARGFKNGEGTFYHMKTGQIQKGMWENDVCKTALVQDEFRNQVVTPTEYPIPKSCLANPDKFVHDNFGLYIENENKPHRSFKELACLNFVRKMKKFRRLESHAVWQTKVPFDDFQTKCTCPRNEPLVRLHPAYT